MSGFREYLTQCRKDSGLTQAEVGRRMGTGQSAVSELETAETPNPTLETLAAWAVALGLQFSVQFTAQVHHSFAVDPGRPS